MTRSLLFAVALAISLSSCGTTQTGNMARLPLPPPLVLPTDKDYVLTPAQDDHLFTDHPSIYQIFSNREDFYLQRIQSLISIIKSTHE